MIGTVEAARILGISIPTLKRRVKEGVIKPAPKPSALKRHRRYLFDRAEIERIAAQG